MTDNFFCKMRIAYCRTKCLERIDTNGYYREKCDNYGKCQNCYWNISKQECKTCYYSKKEIKEEK